MAKRDRFALVFGATMTIGMLATGAAIAAEDSAAANAVTQTIGVSASDYEYEEDDLMSLEGPKLGIDYTIKFPLVSTWFLKGEARYARGKVDYKSNGTGSSDNETSWYAEWRLLSGYDFAFGNHTLGPFAGLGFRYLEHDGRGISSTGHIGYRRESRYLYLPLGLAHRWSFGGRSSLTTTIEYDYLIKGQQTTELNDTAGYVTTPAGTTLVSAQALKNDQDSGHGWRGSIMLNIGNWSMGPYASYWRISTSDVSQAHAVDDVGDGWIISGVEPKNKTTEAGFKAAYIF